MKGRPRRTEREVASHLSEYYKTLGLTPVKRVPIIGRTGPDIEINELGLIVDVKSRKSVPKTPMPEQEEIVYCPGVWIGARLEDIDLLAGYPEVPNGECDYARKIKPYKSIIGWLDHMDEWTQLNRPNDISALVLHRTGGYISNSLVVIKQQEVFYDRVNYFKRATRREHGAGGGIE